MFQCNFCDAKVSSVFYFMVNHQGGDGREFTLRYPHSVVDMLPAYFCSTLCILGFFTESMVKYVQGNSQLF